MIEKKPISIETVGRLIGISGQKLYRWYKEVLSIFTCPEEQSSLHENDTIDSDLIDRETSQAKTVEVPILKIENFGEDLTIDDKNIGRESYTIITNRKSGKIVLMAKTIKTKILIQILSAVPVNILFGVKTVSKDLAENYDWLVRTVFMNATRIADKFHVLTLAFEALQAIRIRYRQAILTKEREFRRLAKARQKEGNETKIESLPQKKYENGDTEKELLARSRYLLFRMAEDWSESQVERAKILFREFPEIKVAYEVICNFRNFYKGKIGDLKTGKLNLCDWYDRVKQADVDEISNFASMVDRHEGEILNYFEQGYTNANAESLNSRIQSFIQINSGTRDRNFFHFRLKNYFS